MKAKTWVLGVVVLGAAITAACSSTPTHPPIETSGGSNPGPAGGGGSSPAQDADGGTTASGDAGTPIGDGGAAATSCNNGNCNGCCDTLQRCQPGTSTAVCGVSGGLCLSCQAGAICSGGFCQ